MFVVEVVEGTDVADVADVYTPHIPQTCILRCFLNSHPVTPGICLIGFLFVWGKRNLQIQISLINIHIYFTWKMANTDVSQALRVIKTQLVGKGTRVYKFPSKLC